MLQDPGHLVRLDPAILLDHLHYIFFSVAVDFGFGYSEMALLKLRLSAYKQNNLCHVVHRIAHNIFEEKLKIQVEFLTFVERANF